MTTYFALQDRNDDRPWGVLRFDPLNGRIERWNSGTGWFTCPSAADVVVGGEPGAHEITEASAEALIASGALTVLSASTVEHFRGAP